MPHVFLEANRWSFLQPPPGACKEKLSGGGSSTRKFCQNPCKPGCGGM